MPDTNKKEVLGHVMVGSDRDGYYINLYVGPSVTIVLKVEGGYEAARALHDAFINAGYQPA